MKLSNRRNLIKTAVAGATILAISPAGSLLAQVRREDTSFESSLTGSVVELLGAGWEFNPDLSGLEETDEYFVERVVAFSESLATTVEIEFVRTTVSAERYMDIIQQRQEENWDIVEAAGSGSGPDGPWLAASSLIEPSEYYPHEILRSFYAEYQEGAYEDANLAVIVGSRPDRFEKGINAAQTEILVGDLAPLTMLDSSQVLALTFPELASETTATSTNSRESRSSRNTGEQGESTDSRRGENQTNTTSGSDYPDAVLAHRTEFMGTFNEFAESLALTIDDAATDAEVAAAFSTIDGLAEQWIGYPARAAQLVAPTEYSSLEGLYITWADEIATLGSSYLGLYDGTSNVDTMFDQIDVVDQADRALISELDSL